MNQRISNVEFVGYPDEFISQPIPLVHAGVSAGFPSPADDYIDRTLDLNELLGSFQKRENKARQGEIILENSHCYP